MTTAPQAAQHKTASVYWRVRPDVKAAIDRLAAETKLPATEVLDQIVRDHLGLAYPSTARVANVLAVHKQQTAA